MKRIPFSNHLIYRLTVVDACILAFIAWAYAEGHIGWLFAFETTGIGYGLVLLAVMGIVGTFHRATKVTTAFAQVKAGGWVDTRKLLIKSGYIGLILKIVMYLGLWANTYGIFLSFTMVDFTSIDTILASVSGMYGGLKIAFANTLISIGVFLAVLVNFHILSTATKLLVIDASDLKARCNG
jgi:hypothetical protein